MVYITRDGKDIVVKISFKALKNWVATFRNTEPNEISAELTVNDLNENVYNILAKIRQQEYEQGWSDAKAKRRKKEYFKMGWYLKNDS